MELDVCLRDGRPDLLGSALEVRQL